jgi:hypothetical protein
MDFDFLEKLLKKNYRLLEIDAQGHQLLDFLYKKGFSEQYLGLASSSKLQSLKKENSKFVRHFSKFKSAEQIKANNADILILSGKSSFYLWMLEFYRHVEYIFIPYNLSILLKFFRTISVFRHLKRNNIIPEGILNLGDKKYFVFRIAERIIPLRKLYISPQVGINDFFEKVKEQSINYVILRWFKDLPNLEEGEDIDILISDEDIFEIRRLTGRGPGIIPGDLFSVSGLPGTSFRNTAYYPPQKARQIISQSIFLKDLYRIPSLEDYFFSLVYHALYHKGELSGLKTSNKNINQIKNPEHDYENEIRTIAKQINLEIPIDMESLDEYLAKNGWQPSKDMLRRISKDNQWIKERFFSNNDLSQEGVAGLTVFVIRKRAIEHGHSQLISNMIEEAGFNILFKKKLSEKEIEVATANLRGGNWSRGPWATSGGDPAFVIIACDLIPIKPSIEEKEKFHHLSNSRILIKQEIRDFINNSLKASEKYNVIHSSDNSDEAREYIKILAPESEKDILDNILNLKKKFNHNFQAIKDLSGNSKRAKVELIKYKEGLAVCKTFRPGREEFLEREIFVMSNFSKLKNEIPKILETGNNYIVYPYYKSTLKKGKYSFLPLTVAGQAIEILRFFYDQGYYLLDTHYNNLLLDRKGDLKIVDFEFVQRYKEKPKTFAESFDIVGVPDRVAKNFNYLFGQKGKRTYKNTWQRKIGLDFNSLRNDPDWKQKLKRIKYRLTTLPRFLTPFVRKKVLYPSYIIRRTILIIIDKIIRRIIVMLFF